MPITQQKEIDFTSEAALKVPEDFTTISAYLVRLTTTESKQSRVRHFAVSSAIGPGMPTLSGRAPISIRALGPAVYGKPVKEDQIYIATPSEKVVLVEEVSSVSVPTVSPISSPTCIAMPVEPSVTGVNSLVTVDVSCTRKGMTPFT